MKDTTMQAIEILTSTAGTLAAQVNPAAYLDAVVSALSGEEDEHIRGVATALANASIQLKCGNRPVSLTGSTEPNDSGRKVVLQRPTDQFHMFGNKQDLMCLKDFFHDVYAREVPPKISALINAYGEFNKVAAEYGDVAAYVDVANSRFSVYTDISVEFNAFIIIFPKAMIDRLIKQETEQ